MTRPDSHPKSLELASFGADHGVLTVFSQSLPDVEVKNVFWISDIPLEAVRGRHAHYCSTQYLIALGGVMNLSVASPNNLGWHYRFVPGSPCIIVPPGLWVEVTSLESPSSFLVIADRPYDESDYIRSREAFYAANFPEP